MKINEIKLELENALDNFRETEKTIKMAILDHQERLLGILESLRNIPQCRKCGAEMNVEADVDNLVCGACA